MSDSPEKPDPHTPPPIKPDNVLDSILSEGGPMPSAKFALRGLAFLLDFILITAVASVIVWKIALPQSHPGAWYELSNWSESYAHWYAEESGQEVPDIALLQKAIFTTGAAFMSQVPPTGPEGSDELNEALQVSYEIRFLIFWLYFAVGEGFFNGISLGKRICRIRSVSTVTLSKPPVLSGIVRGGMKTISIFWLFPILFVGTFIALFFNKRRQLGHDLFARTAVVDEKFVNLQQGN